MTPLADPLEVPEILKRNYSENIVVDVDCDFDEAAESLALRLAFLTIKLDRRHSWRLVVGAAAADGADAAGTVGGSLIGRPSLLRLGRLQTN